MMRPRNRGRESVALTMAVAVVLQAIVVGALSVTPTPALASELPPTFVLGWGIWDCESCAPAFSGPSQFDHPTGVAVDRFDNVFVTDTSHNRIEKFDSSGNPVWGWGSQGSGEGQFEGPTGVAVDPSGNVDVVDAGNHRVQTFDSNGTFLTAWGSEGWGDGQFQTPSGISAAMGFVWVTDTTRHQVLLFNENGAFVQAWGTEGSDLGAFESPTGVAADGSGNVYVADTGNHRIQKFSVYGNFLDAWGQEGAGQGELESPAGVAVDGSGDVYVADTGNHRIQKFNGSGNPLAAWGSEGADDGQFEAPAGVAVDGSGQVFVADTGNDRIQKFGPPTLGLTVSKAGAGSGMVSTSPSGIDCGATCSAGFANGSLVTLTATPDAGSAFVGWSGDCGNNGECILPMTQARSVTATFAPGSTLSVAKDGPGSGAIASTPGGINCGASCSASFATGSTVTLHPTPDAGSAFIGWSSDCPGGDDCMLTMDAPRSVTATFGQPPPPFRLTWGSYGSGDGQFSGFMGVAVNGSGDVFVPDQGNSRVEKFDNDGRFLSAFGSFGTGNGQFNSLSWLTLDGSGNVFVVDYANGRIQKFDDAGHFVSTWLVVKLNGIAVDASGNVYITDNAGIQKFDNDGNLLSTWGSFGSGDGQFNHPSGIAVDGTGNVFVIDSGNNRVEKLDSDGQFLRAWGSLGSGYGQFNGPAGLAVDGSGDVYVTENGFHVAFNPFSRIQKFDNDGHFLSAWGSSGSGDGQLLFPYGVAVDGSGNVFVADNGNGRIQKFGHPTFGLSVSKAGSGSGTVAASVGSKIDCGTTCSAGFQEGTVVTLTEVPDTGSVFTGWSANCTIVGDDCQVTMDQARSVSATFASVHTITLTVAGPGSGSVDVDKSVLVGCGSTLVLCYEAGQSVTLTAAPASGSTFAEWTGDCSGTGTCTLSTDSDTGVTATFALATHTLSATIAGSGFGTIRSSEATPIIDCPATCSAAFDEGTPVVLTPTPALGSAFAGWSGGCTGIDCMLTMNTDVAVTATFAPIPFAVASVDPSSLARGVTRSIQVLGTSFVSGSTVAISGSGVTVSAPTFVDSAHLSVTVTVSGSAPATARNVSVTNPAGGGTATCTGCLMVNVKPTITTMSPSALPQGAANKDLTLTGTGFEPGAAVSFGGTGITVNTAGGGGTSLALNITIDSAAAVGARGVTVTNPDGGVVTKANAFTVNALPTIGSINPATRGQGVTANVVIGGSGYGSAFVAGGGTVSFGPGITVNTVTRNSATKLTASVFVSGSAPVGTGDVTVANPDGGRVTCAGCFTVNAAPTIAAPLSPSSLPVGTAHQSIVVPGTGFQAGMTASVPGGGVTVNSVTSHGPTSVTLDVSIGSSALPGTRNLTVTNLDGGTVTCAACLTLNPKPVIASLTPTSEPRGASGAAVTMTGTGFQAGATVTISGIGVTATVVSVSADHTTIMLSMSIAANAPTGRRDVTVTNPDAGAGTKTGSFRVT